MTIALYANWTGHALTLGETIADARAKLNAGHCADGTRLGDGAAEISAFDVGAGFRYVERALGAAPPDDAPPQPQPSPR